MIIPFDKRITQKHPELFEFIESKSFLTPIYYVIDWRYRKSTYLVKWLSEQMLLANDEIKSTAAQIVEDNGAQNYDAIVTDVLRFVHKKLTYVTDKKKWDVEEVWEDVTDVWTTEKADCESGSTLVYVLCRLAGVPANRLLMMCGMTSVGGHCWLAYRSQEYPLNWCFMDWCFNYNRFTPNSRVKYYVLDTKIYDNSNEYQTLWFAFSETKSYKGLNNSN